jgi:hypothetical protein
MANMPDRSFFMGDLLMERSIFWKKTGEGRDCSASAEGVFWSQHPFGLAKSAGMKPLRSNGVWAHFSG